MYENNDNVYLYHNKMNYLSFHNIGTAAIVNCRERSWPLYATEATTMAGDA